MTGARTGLGRQARRHRTVDDMSTTTPASVDRALAELPAGTGARAADLTDPALVCRSFGDLGDIDHLVFTAGEPLTLMNLAALDLDKAREFFALRYFGALWAVHAAAPHLQPGGSITLTTGIAGRRPGPGWAVAASICGAVESLTWALAVELAPIRVNAVCPGVVRSPLWASMSKTSREQWYRDTAEAIPAGRVGEADDIAHAYLFCLTEPFATQTRRTPSPPMTYSPAARGHVGPTRLAVSGGRAPWIWNSPHRRWNAAPWPQRWC